LADLQARLWAEHRTALLVVFQAIDAGGKDGTIRHVLSGINPAGVKVVSFKRPSETEVAHDFLWRVHAACPAKGEIGVFNRSHYEDVLVTRVHGLYQDAFADAIEGTSTDVAPWYVIPADHKWYRDWAVTSTLHGVLTRLNPQYPPAGPDIEGIVVT